MLRPRAPAALLLLLATASCIHEGGPSRLVPAGTMPRVATVPPAALALADAAPAPPSGPSLPPAQAEAANAALPFAAGAVTPAAAFRLNGAVPDRMRALDCLADAIYYEAASESEEGQRAVAQVVLNRVRHPAYPNSVCGVVYQGPMRAGGGCQFTFTCDGSLLRGRAGAAWARARRIAADALAGRVDTRVGLATHYHTSAVFPHWAPKLEKAAVIGAHIFYRFPGTAGKMTAFAQAYAAREAGRRPFVAPEIALARRAAATGAGTFALASSPLAPPAATPTSPAESDPLPPSTVREEYRHAGAWRDGLN
ncbi:cell wall hydrolase [Sphingosinicella sp. LY1275]|uniref:cell wall hydrolase n=1 Tax=Sphingosinicella sp. LY1275 TaxID=3095379 RepID=UPI002ADED3E4|nr:cell wall hydrolase [Sphingosinicella sp. LY1275]MEA1014099.1 cell wall hydrolase [Sphingosinicella sp. LY1275]